MKKIIIIGLISVVILLILKPYTTKGHFKAKPKYKSTLIKEEKQYKSTMEAKHNSLPKQTKSRQRLELNYKKLVTAELKIIQESTINEIKDANYIELANSNQLSAAGREHFQKLLQKYDAVSIELAERLLRNI